MSLHTQLRRGPLALALVISLAVAASFAAPAAPVHGGATLQRLVREHTASLDVAAVSLLGGRIRLRPAHIAAR